MSNLGQLGCNNSSRTYPRESKAAVGAVKLQQRTPTLRSWDVNPIFHHFRFTGRFVVNERRQFGELGFARGNMGSVYTAIVRRPLYS